MIPRLGRQGKSFKGAALYYLHDKKAETAHRVEHAETRNLPTQDPELGWRVMAATAKDTDRLKRQAGVDRRGRKLTKPVFHLSTSWHPDQRPDRAHMLATMDSALAALGLERNQAVYVIHNDEPHPHIHAFVNLVNQENGRSNSVKFSKEKLSRWAEEYEREHGVYCEQRITNNAKRNRESQRRAFNRASGHENQKKAAFARHKEKQLELRVEIMRRYRAADNGKAFVAAMKDLGFKVAQGKRIVLIDRDGNTHALTRQLEGVGARELRDKLRGVRLPSTDESRCSTDTQDAHKREKEKAPLSKGGQASRPPSFSREHAREEVYFDRDRQNRQQEKRIVEAGITHQTEKVRTGLLNRLQDTQNDRWGEFYEESLQRRQHLTHVLDDQYGPHERGLRAAIARRERTLRASSRAKRWYLQNFSGEVEGLLNDRRTLANIRQRRGEATAALENELAQRRSELTARHESERTALQRADLKPAFVDEQARSMERQQSEAARRDAEAQPCRQKITPETGLPNSSQRPTGAVGDIHAPGNLNPLAASVASQQTGQSVAFRGAAEASNASTNARSVAIAFEIAARGAAETNTTAPTPGESQG